MNKEHAGKDELKPDNLSNENVIYWIHADLSSFRRLQKIDYFSKNLNLKIISKSYKIQSMFSNKSRTPLSLCSNPVYQFSGLSTLTRPAYSLP